MKIITEKQTFNRLNILRDRLDRLEYELSNHKCRPAHALSLGGLATLIQGLAFGGLWWGIFHLAGLMK